jgi:hypothetical protein
MIVWAGVVAILGAVASLVIGFGYAAKKLKELERS